MSAPCPEPHSPVRGFGQQALDDVTRHVPYGNADVPQVDVVGCDLSPVIARLFPAQYKAHRGRGLAGTHVLILQHGQDGDGIRHGRGDSAGHQLAVGPSSSLVNGLGVKTKDIDLCSPSHVCQVHKDGLCSLEELHEFFRGYALLASSLKHGSYLCSPRELGSSFVTQECLRKTGEYFSFP